MMNSVLAQVKSFVSRHLLLCGLLWMVAAVAIACEAYGHFSQGKTLQALCFDLPFILLALLAAFASLAEWRSRPQA